MQEIKETNNALKKVLITVLDGRCLCFRFTFVSLVECTLGGLCSFLQAIMRN